VSTGVGAADLLIQRAAAALDSPGPPEVGLDDLGRAMSAGRVTRQMWPDSGAVPLFRAAFEAGWNAPGDTLPDHDWVRALLDEFAGSPYGPPARPRRLGH
jgi:hypothetical protein